MNQDDETDQPEHALDPSTVKIEMTTVNQTQESGAQAQADDQQQETKPGLNPEIDTQNKAWAFKQRVSESPLNDGSVFGQLIANSVEGVGSMMSATDEAPAYKRLKVAQDMIARMGLGVSPEDPAQDQKQKQSQKGPKQ